MSLSDALAKPEVRSLVIDDCVLLVDSEVKKKRGLSGIVIKTGYKAVKGIKPGFIRKVVDSLFDRWMEQLKKIWDEAEAAGESPRSKMEGDHSRVADALLKVTDDKAQNSSSGLIRSTYTKLRPTAKKHVEEAVPGLAAVLEKHS